MLNHLTDWIKRTSELTAKVGRAFAPIPPDAWKDNEETDKEIINYYFDHDCHAMMDDYCPVCNAENPKEHEGLYI